MTGPPDRWLADRADLPEPTAATVTEYGIYAIIHEWLQPLPPMAPNAALNAPRSAERSGGPAGAQA
jgi:hypothetical protein